MEALYRDLAALHGRLGPWHAVVVTGDVAFTGQPEEYVTAERALQDLFQRLRELGSNPVLLVVPGSHDVDRTDLAPSEAVEQAFAPYGEWLAGSTLGAETAGGGLPGEFAAGVPGAECRVGVVGLNTALAQPGDEGADGRQALAPGALERLLGEDVEGWLGQFDAALLLTHGSPGRLGPSSRARLHAEIAPLGRFAAHLCAAGERWEDLALLPGQSAIQCRPFHGRTERGYLAGSIAFQGSENVLRVWPRILPRRAAGFAVDARYAYDLTEGDHLALELPAPESARPRSFALAEGGDLAPEPPLVLEYLELRNYRCFEKLLVPLNRPSVLPGRWTCVAGLNGAGKSAILEALSLALLGEPLIRELGEERLGRVRRRVGGRARDAEIRLWLRAGAERRQLALRIGDPASSPAGGPSRKVPAESLRFWQEMRSRLFVAYGTGRGLGAREGDPFGDLSAGVRRVMTLFDPLAPLPSAEALLGPGRGMRAARELLARLVERVFEPDELGAEIVGGRVRFVVQDEPAWAVDLPDGYRSCMAWMAGLCAAWAALEPDRAREGDPAEIAGLALVDAIAAHLHPALQREIVTRLRVALPRLGWVVTSHSPLVLSSFDSREIVALDAEAAGGIRALDRQLLGFSADQVYRWLMGVPPTSTAMERALEQRALAQRTAGARDLGAVAFSPEAGAAEEGAPDIAQILRASPDADQEQVQAAIDDFRRRLSQIEEQGQ
jgi:hypothetical protein